MNKKVKRTGNLYVILVALLMAIAVIAAVAGAMNRSRQVSLEVDDGTTAAVAVTDDVFLPSKDKETEGEKETEKVSEEETQKTDAEPAPEFMNPTGGKLMNKFSIEVPVFSVTMEDYRAHNGVDIFVGVGERVLCAADGTVDKIWEDPMMGNCVSVKHSGGFETIYKNLAPELADGIKEGAKVYGGSCIAAGGESALAEIAEDPHLHFEMKMGGEYVDPCKYISFTDAKEVYED